SRLGKGSALPSRAARYSFMNPSVPGGAFNVIVGKPFRRKRMRIAPLGSRSWSKNLSLDAPLRLVIRIFIMSPPKLSIRCCFLSVHAHPAGLRTLHRVPEDPTLPDRLCAWVLASYHPSPFGRTGSAKRLRKSRSRRATNRGAGSVGGGRGRSNAESLVLKYSPQATICSS